MELSPKAQSVELIKQAKSVLVLSHNDPDGDALGSSLALKLALEKIGKTVDVVISGRMDETFKFLASYDQVMPTLTSSNELFITVDTRATGEELKLGWKRFPETHQIKIIITPAKGSLVPEDVAIERARPTYDLVVILDCSSLERLGTLPQDFPDLFYETPTIAIDHHPTNSYFAKVNWVDMTATSTAEMLVALLESLGRDEPILDEKIATALLVGLITDTGSFQNMSTTPKSLTVAAQLVAAGASHQEIIDRIKTKSLKTLKLWGRALSRVTEEPEARFLWTTITKTDADEVGVEIGSYGFIDELLKTVGDVDFVLLLTEKDGRVSGSLRSVKPEFDVSELAMTFGGGGHKPAAGFEVPGILADHQEEIITKIRQFQLERQATIAKSADASS